VTEALRIRADDHPGNHAAAGRMAIHPTLLPKNKGGVADRSAVLPLARVAPAQRHAIRSVLVRAAHVTICRGMRVLRMSHWVCHETTGPSSGALPALVDTTLASALRFCNRSQQPISEVDLRRGCDAQG